MSYLVYINIKAGYMADVLDLSQKFVRYIRTISFALDRISKQIGQRILKCLLLFRYMLLKQLGNDLLFAFNKFSPFRNSAFQAFLYSRVLVSLLLKRLNPRPPSKLFTPIGARMLPNFRQ